MAEEVKKTRAKRARKPKQENVEEVVVETPVEEQVKEEPEVEVVAPVKEAPVVKKEVTEGCEVTIVGVAGKFAVLNGKKGIVLEKIGGSLMVKIDSSKYSLTIKNVEV